MKRFANNPIITPAQIMPSRDDFEVIGAFNAGVIEYHKEIIMLLRVAERPIQTSKDAYLVPVYSVETESIIVENYKINYDEIKDIRVIQTDSGAKTTSISHFRVARSRDGENFIVSQHPAILPSNKYEALGIEDARITYINDKYYINYSAISNLGITTMLAVTENFEIFTKIGNIFHPDNKDVTIFPEKIEGLYYALHRPSISHFATPDIWIAQSPDLLHWGNHKHLASVRPSSWDSTRIGASAVPFLVEDGWLEIYHGADQYNRYCLGALLLDRERPWIVKERSMVPILEPTMAYEVNGFFGNVVFSCGAVRKDNHVYVYYGVADTSMAGVIIDLEEIYQSFKVN